MPGSVDAEKNSKQSELFSDVISEILLKLSMKTLSKLKCVCKSWSSLISSSRFQQEHYDHRTQQNPLLLITKYTPCKPLGSGSALNFTFSDNHKRTNFSKSVPYPCYFFSPRPCRGLVCLGFRGKPHMLILNPSNEEIILLPQVRGSDTCELKSCCFGFGFAASSQKFKVVLFLRDPTRIGTQCDIFTLGTNYWRETTNPPPFAEMEAAPFVHGSLHLLPIHDSGSQDKHISAFNLETEEYSEIRLPPIYNNSLAIHGMDKDYFCKIYLTELGGSLCLMLVYPPKLELWRLKDYINEEWIKGYTIKTTSLAGHFSTRYKTYPLVFMVDGSIILNISGSGKKLLRCNPEHKFAAEVICSKPWDYTMTYFVESFVSLGKR